MRPPSHSDRDPAFVVVIPVKPPHRGKSRLGELPDEQREALAVAFALDVVAVASATHGVTEVIVVTDDFRLAGQLRGQGATVMPDGASDDLNESLVQAAYEAWRRHPGARVAALCADLPALRPDELAEALAASRADRACFVADAAGTGTAMYVAPTAALFSPDFGPSSARRHRDAGAESVDGPLVSLRHDVDSPGDLGRVLVLGVGRHTSAVMGLSYP